jgi:tyrosyl-tRNA synthetase
MRGAKLHGLVIPLVTNAAGSKFGKTEAGAVWLDPALTSPFRFYQFWLNTDDRDVIRYLRFFTWLDRPTIAAFAQQVQSSPEARDAQRVLAREVTTAVHGVDAMQSAERASAVLFGSSLADATAAEILAVFDDVPSVQIAAPALAAGIATTELAVTAGIAASKGEATRLIKQGGLYVNDHRVTEERGRITADHAIDGRVIVLRKGQRERRLVLVE